MFFEGFLSGCGFSVNFLCPLISPSLSVSLCFSGPEMGEMSKTAYFLFFSSRSLFSISIFYLTPSLPHRALHDERGRERVKSYFLITEQIESMQSETRYIAIMAFWSDNRVEQNQLGQGETGTALTCLFITNFFINFVLFCHVLTRASF